MPPRIDPRDWDRLFRRPLPRRGGPLQAFGVSFALLAVFAALSFGAPIALDAGSEFIAERNALTATAITLQNQAIIATRTAVAASAAGTLPPAGTPTPEAVILGRAETSSESALRSAPEVAPTTELSRLCLGDQVLLLEQRDQPDGPWYRVRVSTIAADCSPQRAPIGSEGWVSAAALAIQP